MWEKKRHHRQRALKSVAVLIDADSKLKQARLSKNAHVLKPDSVSYEKRWDKGNEYLEIKYYDYDAKYLREAYYLNNQTPKEEV